MLVKFVKIVFKYLSKKFYFKCVKKCLLNHNFKDVIFLINVIFQVLLFINQHVECVCSICFKCFESRIPLFGNLLWVWTFYKQVCYMIPQLL